LTAETKNISFASYLIALSMDYNMDKNRPVQFKICKILKKIEKKLGDKPEKPSDKPEILVGLLFFI
jgi:hypothetical protein